MRTLVVVLLSLLAAGSARAQTIVHDENRFRSPQHFALELIGGERCVGPAVARGFDTGDRVAGHEHLHRLAHAEEPGVEVHVRHAEANGGKLPTTQADSNTVTAALTKAQCTAAKSLSIQVNPQFGRLDYSQYTVVANPNTLSQPAGKPSPASTAGLTPAC